jgi:hypothetical protein
MVDIYPSIYLIGQRKFSIRLFDRGGRNVLSFDGRMRQNDLIKEVWFPGTAEVKSSAGVTSQRQ